MSRPLQYDDQFLALVHSDIKEKFLFCIPMKVQSSSFYKTLSLQISLRICSVYDILVGCFILYCGTLTFFEYIFAFLCFFFGVMSINNSINLGKKFCRYYYFWRIFILFFMPISEYIRYNKNKLCYYANCKSILFYLELTLVILFINFYFLRISWSFYKRLQKGQELLVIHGKYLEKMLTNENQKLIGAQQFIPKNSIQSEIEFQNLGNSNIIKQKN